MCLFPVFLSSDICFGSFTTWIKSDWIDSKVREEREAGSVANVYKETRLYKVSGEALNNRISRYDDSKSKGKYHTLDLNEWEEVDYWISDENRIGVGRPQGGKELTIFMQVDEEGKTDRCEHYLLFFKQHYIELRKLRGEDKFKEMIVPENGQIWVGSENIKRKLRVFVGRYDYNEN